MKLSDSQPEVRFGAPLLEALEERQFLSAAVLAPAAAAPGVEPAAAVFDAAKKKKKKKKAGRPATGTARGRWNTTGTFDQYQGGNQTYGHTGYMWANFQSSGRVTTPIQLTLRWSQRGNTIDLTIDKEAVGATLGQRVTSVAYGAHRATISGGRISGRFDATITLEHLPAVQAVRFVWTFTGQRG